MPDRPTSLPARLAPARLPITVAAAAALLCLPFLRMLVWVSDEGILLHATQRMARGEMPYRDFFEFLPPGGLLIVRIWQLAAGDSFAAARLLAILAVALIAGASCAACRRAGAAAPLAALLPLSWAAASQGYWTQLSHHWLTTLLLMPALLAALPPQAARRATPHIAAGLSAGMALLVTPT